MYLFLTFAYLCISWTILPLISFSTINNISISVNNSNFTPDNFKQACHANLGADKKRTVSSSYVSIHLCITLNI